MIKRIFALHTSTHDPAESTSAALTKAALTVFSDAFPDVEIRWTDAAKLNISPNLSCYANGKQWCGGKEAGPYRCWANVKNPVTDEMPVIYDNLDWADTVLFTTSTRWGSRSAVMQNVVERMNTLENRGASFGEPYPLKGKRLGVVVAGLHWKTHAVAKELIDTLKWWGFATSEDCILSWQRSNDPFFEHPDPDKPAEERWLLTPKGRFAVEHFVRSVVTARKTAV